jgi:hypothetical protein
MMVVNPTPFVGSPAVVWITFVSCHRDRAVVAGHDRRAGQRPGHLSGILLMVILLLGGATLVTR